MNPKRRLLSAIIAGFLSLACSRFAVAAEYPDRPIKLVNPFAPGGTIDVVARVMAEKMGQKLGGVMVIENRPGAAGTVAATYVAKGPKDGYNVYFGTSASLGFSKLLTPDLPYDPVTDFTPIAMVGSVPVGIFVNAALNIRSLQELIAYARSKPGELSFASPGVGSVSHLAAEMLKARAKIDMLHVPYTGAAANYWADVSEGRVQLVFAGVTGGLPQVKGGKVRLLAVATRERSKLLPDVPAVGELISGYDAPAWFGLVVAKGTPPDIVEKLQAAAQWALHDPSTRTIFSTAGVDLDPIIDAKTFGAKIPKDIELWKIALANAAGAAAGAKQ